MALKGTLKDFNLADIFQLIGIQKKTGVLTLKNEKEVVTVSFLEGDVVAADSLHRRLEDRLGTVLVKSGRITEAQLQEALKVQKNTLQRMGNILVENRFIEAQDLRDALHIQISQMIYRLFRWRDGEYNFSQEERVDYDKDYVMPMSAESILMEGARILDEWPMIEKGIKSFASVFRAANVEIAAAPRDGAAHPGEEAAKGVTLNDQERLVHSLVDGKRTIQEIVERSTLSEFETCRILYDLITRQILEEFRAGPQKAAVTAAPVVSRPASPGTVRAGSMLLAVVVLAALGYRLAPAAQDILAGDMLGGCLAPLAGATQVETIEGAIGRSRLLRVDFAIQIYYLLNRGYPAELHYLVTSQILKPDAIVDPWGRPFRYEVQPGGYALSMAGTPADPRPFQIFSAPPQVEQQ
ncbi:MAG: hypothetical protein DMF50_00135 [Acidobacteria bacterium]|nr:MAG: hypothetical protein DMF50_00135 [Acidobacteriota bacterium]